MTSAKMYVSSALRRGIDGSLFPDLLHLTDHECNVQRSKDKMSSLFTIIFAPTI
jgi:hypothetical protein